MKSVSDEFDVFDERAAPGGRTWPACWPPTRSLTDLLTVLQRERDQLDLLLDVTNAVVTHLDTRELFRAVAPALRRCCSADVAALSLFDPEAGVLRHHVCDAPDDFCEALGRADGRRAARSTDRRRAMCSRPASRASSRLRISTAFLRARSSARAASICLLPFRSRPRTGFSAR